MRRYEICPEFEAEMVEYDKNRHLYKNINAMEAQRAFKVIVNRKYIGTTKFLADAVIMRDAEWERIRSERAAA